MFESQATIKVIDDPKAIPYDTKCLITAIVDRGITDYYRKITNDQLKFNLIQPSWAPHITISKRNAIVPKQFHNNKIKFQYDGDIRFNGDTLSTLSTRSGQYWFIDCYSIDIMNIRRALGLPEFNKFHITFGINTRPINTDYLQHIVGLH